MSKRYITKHLYTFDFQIKTGNKLLNDKIKIVLGYLIYKTHYFLKELDNNNHCSNDPYIPLSRNKLIKLCGKIENYKAVLQYLEENQIISWYKSGHGNAKNGSYYSGNIDVNHKGTSSKEPYCRKCRLTTVYWNAVKNNALKLIEVKIPNNELINDYMFQDSMYDFNKTNIEFNWDEYYNTKKAREDFEKNLQNMLENNKTEQINHEKKEIDDILSQLYTDSDSNVVEQKEIIKSTEDSDINVEELLGDLVLDVPLPPETGVEEEWDFLESLDVKSSDRSFGDFIAIG